MALTVLAQYLHHLWVTAHDKEKSNEIYIDTFLKMYSVLVLVSFGFETCYAIFKIDIYI